MIGHGQVGAVLLMKNNQGLFILALKKRLEEVPVKEGENAFVLLQLFLGQSRSCLCMVSICKTITFSKYIFRI